MRVLLIVMVSLGIESTMRYRGQGGILLPSPDDMLDPTFLNITIYPLELVDAHALHPHKNTLVVLVVLMLYPPFPLPTTPTPALILLLLQGEVDSSLGVLLLPLLAVVARIGILFFLLWIGLLWVIAVIGVHHELEELSLFSVVLLLEDELA